MTFDLPFQVITVDANTYGTPCIGTAKVSNRRNMSGNLLLLTLLSNL